MIWWAVWLGLIAATFAAREAYALKFGKLTLSRFVWTLSKAWPPFPYFVGFLTGFLVCHFFWGLCY